MQLYLSVFQEVQGDLDVLQLVEAHASFLPWLRRRTQHTSEGAHTVNMRYKYRAEEQGSMTVVGSHKHLYRERKDLFQKSCQSWQHNGATIQVKI